MKENNIAAAVAAAKSRKETILSRRQIEGMIAEGRNVIVFEGRVLKVDAWMKFHPGGEKAIQHMVGKDATDEINAYACPGFCQSLLGGSDTDCPLSGSIRRKLVNICCRSRSVASRVDGLISFHQFREASSVYTTTTQ